LRAPILATWHARVGVSLDCKTRAYVLSSKHGRSIAEASSGHLAGSARDRLAALRIWDETIRVMLPRGMAPMPASLRQFH
jgi:hypothetical protein